MAATTVAGKKQLDVGDVVELHYEIEPVPKGRPRFGRGFVFTDKKTSGFERAIKLASLKQLKKLRPFQCRVQVSSVFGLSTARRVDLDNLIKSLWDGLNGVVWKDDWQVFRTAAEKRIGGEGWISVQVEGIYGKVNHSRRK
jgi:Holliday junction resolvase RusA-like endonuclease